MHAERTYQLIADFMNLVNACRDKGIDFDGQDGFTLNVCADTINDSLQALGYDDDAIAKFWTGEYQLVSS